MLNRTLTLALAGIALACAAPGAHAQSSGSVGEGSTELNFFGTLSDQDAFGTLITAGVGIGKYVNDSLQFKFTQTLTVIDADDVSVFSYAPYGSAEFQLRPDPASPFVLYAGGGIGMSLTTIDAGGFDFFTYSLFLTPVAGAKFFIDERMSLTYSLSYQFPLVEETCGDVDCVTSDTTTLQNFLGFSIYY